MVLYLRRRHRHREWKGADSEVVSVVAAEPVLPRRAGMVQRGVPWAAWSPSIASAYLHELVVVVAVADLLDVPRLE